MKVLFAKDGEMVTCGRCGYTLEADFKADEASDEEDYWCDNCTDYPQKVRIVTGHYGIMVLRDDADW